MYFKDFAYCKLTADITEGVTSVAVDECSRLPTTAQMAANEFLMTFDSTYDLSEFEIVQVTAKSATSGPGTLTVVRGHGSPAYAHAATTVMKHAVTAAMLNAALPKAGGTLTGDVNADGHRVTGLADPTSAQDADTESARNTAISAAINTVNAATVPFTPAGTLTSTNVQAAIEEVAAASGGGGGGGTGGGTYLPPGEHLFVPAMSEVISSVGTWVRGSDSDIGGGYLYNTTAAANDEIVYTVPVGDGTWDVLLLVDTDTNRSTSVDVALDTAGTGSLTSIGTHNQNAARTGNVEVLISGVVLTGTATERHIRVKALTAGYVTVQSVYFRRTAGGTPGSSTGSAYPLGSADQPPTTPNAHDDEFDGTSTATWTTFGSPTTNDVNTIRPGHLYLRASGTGATLVGRVQAAPGSFPFTVETKVVSSTWRSNYHRGGGLCFFPTGAISGSSTPIYFGINYSGGWQMARIRYASLSSFGDQTLDDIGFRHTPIYLRATFSDATHATLDWSLDGWAWYTLETYIFGFSVGQIGLSTSEEGGGGLDAYFDWLRVT